MILTDMSTQRMIKDSFWTDSYIANLDPIEKMIFLYLLTNPLCNIAGVYEIQLRRIAFDTGIDKDMLEKVFQRFEKDGKLLRIDDWVLLVNHAKHQSYKNPNVSKGIKRILEELPQKVKALKGFESLSHLTLLNLTLPNETISDKSPIMPFNKNKEEEAVVDYDSGEVVEPVKPQTKKYPNAPAISKIFQEVLGKNPGNWRVNKTQLLACENLYTERTPAKVRSALLYYQANREEKYCPQISSPYDLDSKWTKLGEFKLKQV